MNRGNPDPMYSEYCYRENRLNGSGPQKKFVDLGKSAADLLAFSRMIDQDDDSDENEESVVAEPVSPRRAGSSLFRPRLSETSPTVNQRPRFHLPLTIPETNRGNSDLHSDNKANANADLSRIETEIHFTPAERSFQSTSLKTLLACQDSSAKQLSQPSKQTSKQQACSKLPSSPMKAVDPQKVVDSYPFRRTSLKNLPPTPTSPSSSSSESRGNMSPVAILRSKFTRLHASPRTKQTASPPLPSVNVYIKPTPPAPLPNVQLYTKPAVVDPPLPKVEVYTKHALAKAEAPIQQVEPLPPKVELSPKPEIAKPERPVLADRPVIEVMPGYWLPLCGGQESIAAYKSNAVVETQCTECQVFLYCIDTACMVLCPMCRSISPVSSNNAAPSERCLGIGLTIEVLLEQLQTF